MSKLFVVATPIGNLNDISYRAVSTLKESDIILCEDTRVAKKLLDRYEIESKLYSYHKYSSEKKLEKIIEILKSGSNVSLISDAGTPGISDPGSHLVSMARLAMPNLEIIAIPGPSALSAALSIAGDGFDRFTFYGFLPHKKGRQTLISEIAKSQYATVVYESKHRVLKLMDELIVAFKEVAQEKEVVLIKELTKMFEQTVIGSAMEIKEYLNSEAKALNGEFVVLIRQKKIKK